MTIMQGYYVHMTQAKYKMTEKTKTLYTFPKYQNNLIKSLTYNRNMCTLYKWFQWEMQLTEY